jgi:hypothetical protein
MISYNELSFNSLRGVSWGKWSPPLQIFEIYSPVQIGPLEKIFSQHTEGLLVSPRLLVLIAFSGGHLKETPEQILSQLKMKFRGISWKDYSDPLQEVIACLSWLEGEQNSGILERCLISLAIFVNIDETHLWVWRVGGNGILVGPVNGLHFRSTDQREEEFRRLGILPPRPLRFPESDLIDKIIPCMNLKTPSGYESFLIELNNDTIIVALNQSALPFGPWPTAPQDISTIWTLDAGWKYGGLAAHGIIIGEVEISTIGWPYNHRQITI